MKKDIHPEYKKTVIKCVCGNEIETGSVVDNLTVEICNNCQKVVSKNSENVINKNSNFVFSFEKACFDAHFLWASLYKNLCK